MFGNFIFNLFSKPVHKVFKYKKEVNAWGRKFYRPIATLYIKHKDSSWHPYSMYIDSGADITTINKSFGNLIGLRLKPKEQKHELNGVGGKEEFVYRDIEIRIIKKVFNIKVAWVQNNNIPLLLGREGVFEKYTICFREKQQEIEFIEH